MNAFQKGPMGVSISTRARSIVKRQVLSEDLVKQERGLYFLALLTTDNAKECRDLMNTADGVRQVEKFVGSPTRTLARSAAVILRNLTSNQHCLDYARSNCKVLARRGIVDQIMDGVSVASWTFLFLTLSFAYRCVQHFQRVIMSVEYIFWKPSGILRGMRSLASAKLCRWCCLTSPPSLSH
jgi:hypothetical protein